MTFNQSYAHSLLSRVMDELLEEKCEAFLLGCTEIPLAITEHEYRGVPVLNPSWIMARNPVRIADASKLKSL